MEVQAFKVVEHLRLELSLTKVSTRVCIGQGQGSYTLYKILEQGCAACKRLVEHL